MLSIPKLPFALSALGLVVLVGVGAAAITLSYSESSAEVGARAAPIVFEPGGDAAFTDYVTSLRISPNGTSFDVALRGVPELTIGMTDLLRIKNQDTRAHDITLGAAQVTNAHVLVYKLEFYDGATRIGTLDMKAASPSVSFPAMPAGATYTVRATLALASGAGLHTVSEERGITLLVSA